MLKCQATERVDNALGEAQLRLNDAVSRAERAEEGIEAQSLREWQAEAKQLRKIVQESSASCLSAFWILLGSLAATWQPC